MLPGVSSCQGGGRREGKGGEGGREGGRVMVRLVLKSMSSGEDRGEKRGGQNVTTSRVEDGRGRRGRVDGDTGSASLIYNWQESKLKPASKTLFLLGFSTCSRVLLSERGVMGVRRGCGGEGSGGEGFTHASIYWGGGSLGGMAMASSYGGSRTWNLTEQKGGSVQTSEYLKTFNYPPQMNCILLWESLRDIVQIFWEVSKYNLRNSNRKWFQTQP